MKSAAPLHMVLQDKTRPRLQHVRKTSWSQLRSFKPLIVMRITRLPRLQRRLVPDSREQVDQTQEENINLQRPESCDVLMFPCRCGGRECSYVLVQSDLQLCCGLVCCLLVYCCYFLYMFCCSLNASESVSRPAGAAPSLTLQHEADQGLRSTSHLITAAVGSQVYCCQTEPESERSKCCRV